MNKKETISKIKNFEKEYKKLNSKIEREFNETDIFNEQYSTFKDQFYEETTKRSMNLKMLEDNMNIILLNIHLYICNRKFEIISESHKSLWFKFIDDTAFKTKYLEIADKLSEIAPEEVTAVTTKQIDDLKIIEKKDLRDLMIIGEQSKKAKKNSMFFTAGVGAIFGMSGALVTNLDRITDFFIEMQNTTVLVVGIIIPMIVGVMASLTAGYIFDMLKRS